VGNYTEQDIKMAARAFTGWTFTQPIPLYPYGHFSAEFVYRPEDHDDSVKTFLGHTGHLNGEDIIDIIVKQPATARFISRHLYNFFVADEPQVPAWHDLPPRDPRAIDALVQEFVATNGDIRSVLRVLFNSDFFKESRYKKVKSPVELVVGTIKLVGSYQFPDRGLLDLDTATTAMGQMLFNPPTVEGWHTGKEWIDGGTLNERVNFAVSEVSDVTKPGIRVIVNELSTNGATSAPSSPEELVDRALDLLGSLEVSAETRAALVDAMRMNGPAQPESSANGHDRSEQVSRLLQLIVASREYQFA
jgi:uncharacterized protein (DUF1800 family)